MKRKGHAVRVAGLFLIASALTAALPEPANAQPPTGDDAVQLDAIEVTGSRIKKTELEGGSPVQTITADDIERSGLRSIGDILQRLSVSGSSLNTKFNSAGNFGFPPDGGGVGSGSTTVSLRNLGAKRVLVLVDGLRWVNESSASGVSAAVDLNTIPASAIDRIELLTDGASALYGSDAIAGVVNIITKKKQEGGRLTVYGGDYDVGAGTTKSASVSLGGSGDRFDFFLDLSYFDQREISSAEFEQSSFPVPGTGVANGSSAIPTTRSVFIEPNGNTQGGLCEGDGVVVCNIAGNGTAPGGVPAYPGGFHPFDGGATGDRFNFAPYNLLLTPNERSALFSQIHYNVTDNIRVYLKGVYQSRESVNRAAPEPIFIGPGAGTGGLADTVSVDVTNPYNPFGFSLDAGSNLIFAGRRPVEGGSRVFTQNVDTRYFAGGLQGDFSLAGRPMYWDVNLVSSLNRATQTVQGTYNIAHIARALGPVADCTAPCVPLNFFGGPGTITPEMLAYIQFIENDRSEQDINLWSANLSGSVLKLPAGDLGFATGVEHRRLAGSYAPDSVVTSGETNGVPSLPTSGSYDVDELYAELEVPLLADKPGARSLQLSLAARYSDYSTFGDTTNSKVGLRWAPVTDVVVRATYAEGFRAPSVGELFGSPARFDATLQDPCSLATDPTIIANCATLGVPSGFEQANTQISVRTGGNELLEPETADSFTLGGVYSPSWAADRSWASRMDFSLTYYDHQIDDAIQSPDAQTQLNRCAATLDPAFCDGITRGTSGDINGFNNTLQNLGRIDTQGYDLGIEWVSPAFAFGRLGVDWQTTYVDEYTAVARDTGLAEPRGVGIEVADSAIPEIRSMLKLSWALDAFDANWTMRYISDLTESCAGANGFDVCDDSAGDRNGIGAVVYHDVRLGWHAPFGVDFALGVNNALDKDPPVCLSCSLNGYDASTYDLPGRFAYAQASAKF